MSTIDELNALLINLPGYGLLTPEMKDRALATALIPDVNNVWPGQPNYIETHDVYWAAIGLVGFLQAQPVVRQSSSEGTSVAVDAPSWGGLVSYYRSMSVIATAVNSAPILTEVPIPGEPHVIHTDMSGRFGDDDNVDTDLG